MKTINHITENYLTEFARAGAIFQIVEFVKATPETEGRRARQQIADLMRRLGVAERPSAPALSTTHSVEVSENSVIVNHRECGWLVCDSLPPRVVNQILDAIFKAAAGALGYDNEGEYVVEETMRILEEYGEIQRCGGCQDRARFSGDRCEYCSD